MNAKKTSNNQTDSEGPIFGEVSQQIVDLRLTSGIRKQTQSPNGRPVSAEFELKAESGFMCKDAASTLKIHTLTEFVYESVD